MLGRGLAKDGQKAAALAALPSAVDPARTGDDRPRAALARLSAEGKLPK